MSRRLVTVLARMVLHRKSSTHLVPDDTQRALCGVLPRMGGWVEEPEDGRATCRTCAAVAHAMPAPGPEDRVSAVPVLPPIPPEEVALVDRLAAEWPHVARILAEAAP